MSGPDLFGPVATKPRVLRMHAVDHGQAPGLMPGWRTTNGARFKCSRCGHDGGWEFDLTNEQIRRGRPCPNCNGASS